MTEALRLTEWFDVFPLAPDGKPLPNCQACKKTGGNSCPSQEAMLACKCLHCHSFFRSSRFHQSVSAMWDQDDYLIGVETGLGFIVLDFDTHGEHDGRPQFAEWNKHKLLPTTVSAFTGGGGCHLYYRLPEDVIVRNTQPLGTVGVDVKGSGGYVVAPPSSKTGKPTYRWVPKAAPWEREMVEIHPGLLEIIQRRPKVRVSQARETLTFANMGLLSWMLNNFPDGGSRNNHLFQASCIGGEIVAQGHAPYAVIENWLVSAGEESGLTSNEIRATVVSGMNRGIENVEREQA